MGKTIGKIFVYLIGAAFIAVGVLFYIDHTGNNIENPVETSGLIIKIDESLNSNTLLPTYEYSAFRPIIKFVTESGKELTFIELYAKGDKSDYLIGQKVNVIYNKNNPEEAQMLHKNSFFGEHLILIGLGLLIIFIRFIV